MILALRLGFLCILLFARVASGQTLPSDQVAMTVDLGWAGMTVEDRWNPLRVNVTGRATAVGGRIVVTLRENKKVTHVTEAPFVATPNATVAYDMAIPFRTGRWWGGAERSINVLLIEEGGRRLMSQSFSTTPAATQIRMTPPLSGAGARLAAYVGRTSFNDGVAAWGGDLDSVNTHYADDPWATIALRSMSPSSLPTVSQAYDSLELLVIRGRELEEVDASVGSTVRSWVESGGRLVIVGGATTLLDVWTPQDVQLSSTFAEPSTEPGRLIVRDFEITGDPSSGWRVRSLVPDGVHAPDDWDEAAEPKWVVEGPLGLGYVVMLGGDFPDVYPDARIERAWKSLLRPVLDHTLYGLDPDPWMYESKSAQARARVFDYVAHELDQIKPFSFYWILGFGCVFGLTISLIDALLTRRLRLSGWSWTTVVFWTLLFSAAAFVIPKVLRSGETQLRRVEVLDQAPGASEAYVTGVTGVFAGREQMIDLEGWAAPSWWTSHAVSSNVEMAIIPVVRTQQGIAPRPRSLPMRIWRFATLSDQGVEPAPVDVTAARASKAGRVVTGLRLDSAPLAAAIDFGAGALPLSLSQNDAGEWVGEVRRGDTDSIWRTETTPQAASVSPWMGDASESQRAWDRAAHDNAKRLARPASRELAFERRIATGRWALLLLTYRADGADDTKFDGIDNARVLRLIRVLIPVVEEDAA